MFDPTVVEIEGFHIRSARYDDLDDLLEVERDAQPAPWTRVVMERELDVEFSSTWVVDYNEVACAFLVFWQVRDEIHILNVAVHSDFRRKGIARGLLVELEQQAVENRMTIITLEVRASNEPAQTLYDGLGYNKIATRPRYYTDNGEDAWVLSKIMEEPD